MLAITLLAIATATVSALPQSFTQWYIVCTNPSQECLAWSIQYKSVNNEFTQFHTNSIKKYCTVISPYDFNQMRSSIDKNNTNRINDCKSVEIKQGDLHLVVDKRIRRPRLRRQITQRPRGKYRGQTQSQYLAMDRGTGKGDGRAEAHSDSDSSRASVSGSSGMGQAQSQTMYDPSCDECNANGKDLDYLSRGPYKGDERNFDYNQNRKFGPDGKTTPTSNKDGSRIYTDTNLPQNYPNGGANFNNLGGPDSPINKHSDYFNRRPYSGDGKTNDFYQNRIGPDGKPTPQIYTDTNLPQNYPNGGANINNLAGLNPPINNERYGPQGNNPGDNAFGPRNHVNYGPNQAGTKYNTDHLYQPTNGAYIPDQRNTGVGTDLSTNFPHQGTDIDVNSPSSRDQTGSNGKQIPDQKKSVNSDFPARGDIPSGNVDFLYDPRTKLGPTGDRNNGWGVNTGPLQPSIINKWPLYPGSIPGADGKTVVCCVISPDGNTQYLGPYGTGSNGVSNIPQGTRPGDVHYNPGTGSGQVPSGQYGPGTGSGQVPSGQYVPGTGSGQVASGQYGPGTGSGRVPSGQYGPISGHVPGGQYGPVSGSGQVPGGQYKPGTGSSQVPGGQYGPGTGSGQKPGGQYGPGTVSGQVPGGQYGPGTGNGQAPGGQYGLGTGSEQTLGGPYGPGAGSVQVPGGQYGPGTGSGQAPGGQYGLGTGSGQVLGGQYGPGIGNGQIPGGQYGPGTGSAQLPGGQYRPGTGTGQVLGGQYGPGTGSGQVPSGQYGPGTGSGQVPSGQYVPGTGSSQVASGQYGPGTGSGQVPSGQYGPGNGSGQVPSNQYGPGTGSGPTLGGQYGPGSSHGPGGQYGLETGSGQVPSGQYGSGTGSSQLPGGQYGPGSGNGQISGGQYQPGTGSGQVPVGQYGPGTGSGHTPGVQYGPGTGSGYTPGAQYGPGNGNGYTPGSQYGPGTGSEQVPGGQYRPGTGNGQVPGGHYGPGTGSSQLPSGQYGPGSGTGQVSGGQYGPETGNEQVPGGQYGPGSGQVLGGQYRPGSGTGSSQVPGSQYGPSTGSGQVPGGQYGPGTANGQLPGGQYGPGSGTGQISGGQYGPGTGSEKVPGGQYGPSTGSGKVPGGQYGQGSGQIQGSQHGPESVTGQVSAGQPGTGTGSGQVPGGQFGLGTGSGQVPGSQYGPGSGHVPDGQYGPVTGSGQVAGGQYVPGTGSGQLPGGQYGPGMGSGQYGPGYNEQSGGIPQNVLDPNSTPEKYDSEAEASIAQNVNGTIASASSKGGNDKGHAQTNVQGTYTGSGSFSAQADITDESKGAHSEVAGDKKGSKSSAQGKGLQNLSQASVQLGSETGSLQTLAESKGTMHSSNSQVQGSVKGGMADAQARGPGSTSSQAQIGFTPYKEGDKSHDTLPSPFIGKGLASAQSSGRLGQSQSNLQGTFKYGISYNGAAQAGASIDKDAVFQNRAPFKQIDVFDEKDKNINVNTDNPSEVTTSLIEINTESNGISDPESKYAHNHSDHHKLESPPNTPAPFPTPTGSKRSFQSNDGSNADYEYTTGKYDNRAEDYYPDGNFGPDGSENPEIEQSEYSNYDEYPKNEPSHESLQTSGKKNIDIKQTTGGNTQHIVLGSLDGQDAVITQRNSDRPDENKIYQPGERVPGTGGYTIPIGFTGSVKSVASKDKTYVVGNKHSPSQAQTVSLTPGTGKIKYSYPAAYGKNIDSTYLRSLYDAKRDDPNKYMSVSKSVTRDLDSENNIRKQYSHTYYTKSSSCGYFTFTCTMVSGADGRKKVCRPKIPTNPDGTPMKC